MAMEQERKLDEKLGNWCDHCDKPKPSSDTFCSHCGNRLSYVIHTEDFKASTTWLVRVANKGDLSFYLCLIRDPDKSERHVAFRIVNGKLICDDESLEDDLTVVDLERFGA